jgi:hypothetical protein
MEAISAIKQYIGIEFEKHSVDDDRLAAYFDREKRAMNEATLARQNLCDKWNHSHDRRMLPLRRHIIRCCGAMTRADCPSDERFFRFVQMYDRGVTTISKDDCIISDPRRIVARSVALRILLEKFDTVNVHENHVHCLAADASKMCISFGLKGLTIEDILHEELVIFKRFVAQEPCPTILDWVLIYVKRFVVVTRNQLGTRLQQEMMRIIATLKDFVGLVSLDDVLCSHGLSPHVFAAGLLGIVLVDLGMFSAERQEATESDLTLGMSLCAFQLSVNLSNGQACDVIAKARTVMLMVSNVITQKSSSQTTSEERKQ